MLRIICETSITLKKLPKRSDKLKLEIQRIFLHSSYSLQDAWTKHIQQKRKRYFTKHSAAATLRGRVDQQLITCYTFRDNASWSCISLQGNLASASIRNLLKRCELQRTSVLSCRDSFERIITASFTADDSRTASAAVLDAVDSDLDLGR